MSENPSSPCLWECCPKYFCFEIPPQVTKTQQSLNKPADLRKDCAVYLWVMLKKKCHSSTIRVLYVLSSKRKNSWVNDFSVCLCRLANQNLSKCVIKFPKFHSPSICKAENLRQKDNGMSGISSEMSEKSANCVTMSEWVKNPLFKTKMSRNTKKIKQDLTSQLYSRNGLWQT